MNLSYPPRRKRRRWLMPVIAILVIAAAIYWLRGKDATKAQGPAPAVPVTVRTMQSQTVRVWTDYSGRLNPVDAAEIRPEVSGRIVKLNFQDGQTVKRGDVLFVIDPGPYEAAVARAEAALATARTQAQFAAMEQKRAAAMVKTDAIARRLYDERITNNQAAIATIKSAEAALKTARIDLDRAYVKAPITGRAGRAEMTVGNLVQAGPGAPLLTTVVANESIYADFEVDEQHYLHAIRRAAPGRDGEQQIPVKLKLSGDNRSYQGTIYSFDNQLNSGSGTIRARAKLPNRDGALLPGMFVTVSLADAQSRDAMRVPEPAIGFDQSKKYVYIVDAKDAVVYREVQLGESVAGERIVLSGLKSGDRVIVDGVQHVRPGAQVKPTEAGSAKPVASAKGV